MIVGFTGTQHGMTAEQSKYVWAFFRSLGGGTNQFHHGDCVGADAEAHDLAYRESLYIVIHPPIVKAKRAFKIAHLMLPAKDYIDRNHDIVDACEVLIATPKMRVEELRSGTWATIRYARKKHKKMFIVYPDGSWT